MTKKGDTDWVESTDDNFFNQTEQILEVLEKVTEMGGITQENWKHWGIPEAKFKTLTEKTLSYIKLYKKAQKKKDRTAADVDNHRQARSKDLEPYLRTFVNQYIRYEDQVPRGDKIKMLIIPKDETPSPVHGSHIETGAPVPTLRNLDGAIMYVRCKRPDDQTRYSMPKGYRLEISYQIGDTPPADPEQPGMKTDSFSKASFQLKLGMSNLGKTLYIFVKYKHKTTPALDSGWSDLHQKTIA
jgi:hypothetical protein